MKIRKEVMWFAGQMEKVLRDNDDKDHWSGCNEEYLLNRLTDEVKELALELTYPSNVKQIINEAVDVANFAMMIADNARQERE